MKPFTPRDIPGRNCIQMSMENILFYMNYELPVYKQLSLTYAFNSKDLGRFYSGFFTLKEEMKWINNINIQVKQANDSLIFISSVKELLNEKIPVVIFVNPFVLKYSTNYQRRNVPHTITLVGYEGDTFKIIDDAQNFQGDIFLDELLEAISKAKHKYRYLYFPKEQVFKDIGEQHILDVIKKNTTSLKGNLDQINPDIPIELQTINGIKSIDKFIEDSNLFLDKIYEHENKNFFLDEIYRGIYGVSNQHFIYSEFLSKTSHLTSMVVSEITNLLNVLSQEWKIVAIMFMKSRYRMSKNFNESLIRKMEEIKCLEEELVQKSEKLLFQYV
ncbi:C39 family peptidase [Cytobacillus oceanisediminis]|uniref:C39 family peptidase n=1 Tax=Cytobacillus oceanisediminis TaxID=665099 RepID=UPI002079E120|nr:C39 family peptidase [Cytobacillus oceanisediminis]USK44113.1 C39 family peptidase [Cytobacillus oceanisediminis]